MRIEGGFLLVALGLAAAGCGASGGRAEPDGGMPKGDGGGSDTGDAAQGADARDGQASKDAGGDGSSTDSAMTTDAHGDGAKSDGATDASDGAEVTCAGKPCFTGQSCVSGVCTFASCSGYQVPGDYATLAAALAAVSPKGGTICLGAQAFDETVGVGTATSPGTVTIQGVSPDKTSVTSLSVESGSSIPTVVVKGITLGSLFMLTGPSPIPMSVTVAASKLQGLSLEAIAGNVNLTLDGVEVTASGESAPVISLATSDDGVDAQFVIQNSYIHDSGGISVAATFSWGGALSIATTMVNNTFENNATAVTDSAEGCCGWSVTHAYYNNLFVSNGMALNVTSAPDLGNNAFFGNTTNYGGAATDGPGTVKADPKLDATTTPPGLLAGSPCRGAADATHAPSHDYWGRARGPTYDIGAVQSSP